jgi:SpoVK/Ycf46/Vps4 family AAA+-type ATPase
MEDEKDTLEGEHDLIEGLPGEVILKEHPDRDSPFEFWNQKIGYAILLAGGYLYYFRGFEFMLGIGAFIVGFWMLSFAWRRPLQVRHLRNIREYQDYSPDVRWIKPVTEVPLRTEERHERINEDGVVNPYFKWRHYLAIPILVYGVYKVPRVALGVALILPVATVLWTSVGDYKPVHPLNPLVYWLSTPLRWFNWVERNLLPTGLAASGWNAFHLLYVVTTIPLVSIYLYLDQAGASQNKFIQAGVLFGPLAFIVGAVAWKRAISGRYSILAHTLVPGVSTNHWEWFRKRRTVLRGLSVKSLPDTYMNWVGGTAPNGSVSRTIWRYADPIDLFERYGDYSNPENYFGPVKLDQWEVTQIEKHRGEPDLWTDDGQEGETDDSNNMDTTESQPESDQAATPESAAVSSSSNEEDQPTATELQERLENARDELEYDWQMPPAKDFGDIGGYSDVKAELTQDVLEPVKADNPAYDRFDISPDHGILFHGPPGTGKTLFAQALASMLGRPFVKLDQSRLSDWRVDSMPQKVGRLFEEAEALNGVIFIDEVDQLIAQRGDDQGTNKQQKVTNAFLTRISESDDPNFIFIGTTNRLGLIDDAMLRPGRFGKQIEVDKPDVDARLAILQTKVRDYTDGERLDGLEDLAEQTEGWTGDELDTLVRRARKNAADERADSLRLEHFPDDPQDFVE